MVALCIEHHAHADAAAFPAAQLREFKRRGGAGNPPPNATVSWMRDDLIAFVGGIFYVDVTVAVQLGRHEVVSFNRDADGGILLNINVPSISGEPRLRMEDNFWIETGEPEDLECPPSGKAILATYKNGDRISIRFREVASKEEFMARYPADDAVDEALAKAGSDMTHADIALAVAVTFPVAVAEIELSIADTPIDLRSTQAVIDGRNRAGAWVMDSPFGYVVRVPDNHPWAGQSELQKQLYAERPTPPAAS